MTGWCSWYHYYGKETAADILTNARHLAHRPFAENSKSFKSMMVGTAPPQPPRATGGIGSPEPSFPKGCGQ